MRLITKLFFYIEKYYIKGNIFQKEIWNYNNTTQKHFNNNIILKYLRKF